MLEQLINGLTTSGYGMQLPQLVKIAGIKTKSKRKADLIDGLYRYLNNEANIRDIWKNLNAFEKEFVSEYVRAQGHLEYSEIVEIMKKHKQNKRSSSYYYQGQNSWENEEG